MRPRHYKEIKKTRSYRMTDEHYKILLDLLSKKGLNLSEFLVSILDVRK
jgi:hypothetical protein